MANMIILIPLSLIYAFLCICCFMEYQRRTAQKSKSVFLPNYMLWIGLLAGVFFLALAWFAAKDDGSIGLTIGFGAFVLLAMLLMLGWRNCFITYDDDGITQYNLIGMQRSFTFDQVTGWHHNKRNPTESVLFANGKKITFNFMSEDGAAFLLTVSAKYREFHGNKNIPTLTGLQKERGGFCAHVYNPGEYLAVFIMMLVFILGSGIWIGVVSFGPITENDCENYILTFSFWEIDEHSIVLTSPQVQDPLEIRGYEKYLSETDQFLDQCDNHTTFSVWAKRYTPKKAQPYYIIYALSSEEATYLTFEGSTAQKREAFSFFVGLYGIVLLIFFVFSYFIYIVGSHPEKFPKWVVYSCFQKNAIDV